MHDNPGQSLRAETWIQLFDDREASTHEFLGKEGAIIVNKRTNIPFTTYLSLAAVDQSLSKDV